MFWLKKFSLYTIHKVKILSNVHKADLKNEVKNKKNDQKVRNVAIENLTKVYPNGIKAIDNLSFNIKPKEFIVLLGPSGCGKSTLLRMISGLESISDGYIKFDDVKANALPSKDRNLAMVFQNYALYPFMTVSKNISFGLKNKIKKNNEYNYFKDSIKREVNPLFDQIQKSKINISFLRRIDDSTKDDFLRYKRFLKTLDKNNNIYKENTEKLQEIKDYIKKFKKDKIRKEKLKKEIKNLIKLKFKNWKLKNAKIKESSNEILNLYRKKYGSAEEWKNNIPIIIEKVTKMLGIDMYVNRKPSELSGGQRQRVALARAISKETSLYLYDEPLSNLDAKLRAHMRKEIRKIHDGMNSTSIYVTHDQIEAMSMADKIVVMDKGYIQQIGTPNELMEKPLNLFVAKFIGNSGMNVMDVKLISENEYLIGKKSKIKISNQKNLGNVIKGKNNILLGIRPEHIITDPQITETGVNENLFEGVVKETEMIGKDVILTVENKDFGEIQMLTPLSQNVQKKDIIKFVFNQNKTYLYDKNTGYNLLADFNDENLNAKNIWIQGRIEREKNNYLLHKQKNKLSWSEYVRNMILYPFSSRIKEKMKNRKLPPTSNQQENFT